MRFVAKNSKELLIQVGVILGIIFLTILFFFYVYLPSSTNHGETLTVPNLEGIPFENIDEFLTKRNLRYEVTEDSSFSSKYPPLTILQQDPAPNSNVKENRKIYITLNMSKPPSTKMPCLINGSIKNAQAVLKSNGLRLGDIRYKPALGFNSIMAQSYGGKEYSDCEEINEIEIPKGAKINLIAANGLGRDIFPVPDLIGLSLEEAEFVLIGSGLKLGRVVYQETTELTNLSDSARMVIRKLAPGTIIKQKPDSEQNSRIGEFIHLWVSGTQEEYLLQQKADSLAGFDEGPYDL